MESVKTVITIQSARIAACILNAMVMNWPGVITVISAETVKSTACVEMAAKTARLCVHHAAKSVPPAQKIKYVVNVEYA